jgi:transcriptional regulator with XRE-family HTH domain
MDLRQEKGWTQEQMSFECAMSQSFIAHLESKPRRTSIFTLQKICKALEITFSDFFKDMEK